MPSLQSIALLLSAGLKFFTALGYLKLHYLDDFTILKAFSPHIINACGVQTQCWRSLAIFVAILYSCLGLVGLIAAVGFGSFEQRAVLAVLGLANLLVAFTRQFVMPASFYGPDALKLSILQCVIGLVTLAVAALRTKHKKPKPETCSKCS